MRQRSILLAAILIAVGYLWLRGAFVGLLPTTVAQSNAPATPAVATATFAAGCFWCVEADFDKLPGVISTISGYTGGRLKDPTYEQVSSGGTGHTEAVEIAYDPSKVSYQQLLDHFWKNVDPLSAHRQFCDVGDQYRPAIFVHDAAQREAAEASRDAYAEKLGAAGYGEITTEIIDAPELYYAEDYHQQYLAKNPNGYCGLGGTGVSCPVGLGAQ
jgi:peptide-methionine (S)-S-oxide reductase